MDNISEIHMGANVLLAHFHYSCKGYRVFEEGWKVEETVSMAELNTEQAQFIQKTAAYVKANSVFIPCDNMKTANSLGKNLTSLPSLRKGLLSTSTTLSLSYMKKTGSQGRPSFKLRTGWRRCPKVQSLIENCLGYRQPG